MNRKIYLISSFALFLTILLYFSIGLMAAEKSLTGDGSAGNPYQITNASDLMAFRDLVNEGNYNIYGTVTSDIAISSDNWTPIGGTTKATAYAGMFSGNNHTITFSSSNTKNSEGEFQGLFACNTGTIQNITVAGTVSGTDYVGAIAAVNRGTIQNCRNQAAISVTSAVGFAGGITGINYGSLQSNTNEGAVSSSAAGSCIGGIAGAAREGTIQQSFNSAVITLKPAASSEEYTEGCAGGIVGLNYAAAIATSGNTGAVNNTDSNGYTGGVAGLNNGTIEHSYNTATITGSYYAGGITGYNFLNEDAGQATIHNTLNVGTVTENQLGYGSICGINTNGSIYDNYYKEETALAGVGSSNDNGAAKKTEEELKSGEVAYLLNGNQSSNPTWYQTLNEDAYPLLDSTHGIVYRHSENGTTTYTNNEDEHTEHDFDETGTCKICGHKSVELKGNVMTLDGSIGVKFYYYIDPMYYQDTSYEIQVAFTINEDTTYERTETAAFDINNVYYNGNTQLYGFRFNLKSDEMRSAITSTLNITKDGTSVVSLPSEPYQAYNYLKTLYGYENKEIKDVAQGLATYNYYANEYYKHFDSYEPDSDLPLRSLDDIDETALASYTQTIGDQTKYSAKHYGSSLNLLSKTEMAFYISSEENLDEGTLYFGYKTHGSAEDYTYVNATKNGGYYQGITKSVPASELDVMWDVAFFIKQENGTYKQITSIKTAGPLSYIKDTLAKSNNDKMKNLAKAIYLYYETSKAYFASKN